MKLPYFFILFVLFLSSCVEREEIKVDICKANLAGGIYEGVVVNGKPNGVGVLTDSAGYFSYGTWNEGSLVDDAILADSLTTVYYSHRGNSIITYCDHSYYLGEVDSAFVPAGNGLKYFADGTIYDGEWSSGTRTGFGLGIRNARTIQMGFWENDRFKGEKIFHSADRVYGIDISRYQHKAPINWKKIRITSLGTRSNKWYRGGKGTYPVSFMYIKATQGVSIINSYYKKDAVSANKVGIPIGAYHFFSTTDAARQADYFLSVIKGTKLTLPPMLDVELTEDQIFEMGGIDVLFRRIQIWMNIVEKKTGKRPILYVGQTFMNDHFDQMPQKIQSYDMWVARYGEYKPNFHIVYWQLSDDGAVSGIKGAVDINVFNGSRSFFEKYLKDNR